MRYQEQSRFYRLSFLSHFPIKHHVILQRFYDRIYAISHESHHYNNSIRIIHQTNHKIDHLTKKPVKKPVKTS